MHKPNGDTREMKPKLAAFPKAFLDEMCIDGSMTIRQWVNMAATLDVDGLEFFGAFLELQDPASWKASRKLAEAHGLTIPMLCCSPDFTHPDPAFRRKQIEMEKRWIDMTAELGGSYCRVLSGQRRPEVSRKDGLAFCVDCINECGDYGRSVGVTLIIENHYKDPYWTYPEFAQHMDLFCELLDRIEPSGLGVNYDPSNTLLAGEDPLELLDRVKHRVMTMHASDRYLAEGTLEDLRKEENVGGYADRLSHGEIGKGMNDYDAIFSTLASVGFDGWISIEDGMEGMAQLRGSVTFLREKMAQHWPSAES